MLKLVERSAYPAVTLDEVAEHVRRDTTQDDDVLQNNLDAAVAWAEKYTGLALVDQTWDYYVDAFPGSVFPDIWPRAYPANWNRYIEIPKPPLLEVVGVWGRDTTEVEFTDFLVDDASMPARIYLTSTGSWPSTDGAPNAVRIRFRAGFIDTATPPPVGAVDPAIKQAIMIYTAQLYEHRELYIPAGLSVKAWGAEDLLRSHRVETSIS